MNSCFQATLIASLLCLNLDLRSTSWWSDRKVKLSSMPACRERNQRRCGKMKSSGHSIRLTRRP